MARRTRRGVRPDARSAAEGRGGTLSSDALLPYSALQQKYSVYSKVINQNINYYLKEHPGAWLVYESGYKELFGFTGQANVQDTLLAGLACALCFAGLFSMERRGGMEAILCTMPLGRKRTVRAKLAISAGVAVTIAAASCLPHLIQVLRDYGLPAVFAPAMSIAEFESLPAFLTLSDAAAVLVPLPCGRLPVYGGGHPHTRPGVRQPAPPRCSSARWGTACRRC